MSETFFVLFKSGACDLDHAFETLLAYDLTVTRESDHIGDGLSVSRPGSPAFRIRLAEGGHVADEAAEISAMTGAEGLRACSGRFEVSFDDLDAALDEINTLMEIQHALQEASNGFVFACWNGNLVLSPLEE